MLFPVHVYDEGVEFPEDNTYYVVAGNGLFLHKDTGLVKAFIPVPKISILPDLDVDNQVDCSLPKLPALHVERIKEFFKQIVEKHSSESSTTLYFNKETGEYKIHVPEQLVSHGGVDYVMKLTEEETPDFEGFLRVGTIHSHCDFGAFHSGTDINDEKNFDGLHITFGHNDREVFTISASVVVNAHRIKVDPEDYLEGIVHQEADRYCVASEQQHDVSSWVEKVHTRSGSRWGLRPAWSTGSTYSPRRSSATIGAGDKVKWASSPSEWKEKFGKGPFKVDSTWRDFLEVRTDAGLCIFDKKAFVKHEED